MSCNNSKLILFRSHRHVYCRCLCLEGRPNRCHAMYTRRSWPFRPRTGRPAVPILSLLEISTAPRVDTSIINPALEQGIEAPGTTAGVLPRRIMACSQPFFFCSFGLPFGCGDEGRI